MQTAFALKQAEETFGRLGVTLDGPKFESSNAALLALGRAIDVPNKKANPRP